MATINHCDLTGDDLHENNLHNQYASCIINTLAIPRECGPSSLASPALPLLPFIWLRG